MQGIFILFKAVWGRAAGRTGMVLVAAILLFALVGPLLGPDPMAIAITERFSGPSLQHPFGADNLGRDLFARTAAGTRLALFIALVIVSASIVAGAILGILAAFLGGWVDRLVTILFDVISAFPAVILAMGLFALYGNGISNLMIVVTLIFVPQFGRMARAQTYALRKQPFVDAERILGLPRHKMILRHLLPNVIGPMIVLASMNISAAITIEAGLSFLGLGVQPPQSSLGSLIKDGYVFLNQSYAPAIWSVLVLAILTLGFTLFGEALRHASDPRMGGRK